MPVGYGPDLTGEWKSLSQKCSNSYDNMKCQIRGKLKITNIGNLNAKSSIVRFFLSEDSLHDPGDLYLKKTATGKIKRGKSKTRTLSYRLPKGETVSGKYIIAVIDADGAIPEIEENNNIAVFGPVP